MKRINHHFITNLLIGISVFCLPFTQLGINLGGFSLTFSDIFLLISFALIILFSKELYFPNEYGTFLIILVVFIGTLGLSIIKAVAPIRTIMFLLPWIYALIFLVVLSKTSTSPTLSLSIFYILFISLILSTIPSYLNLLGLKIPRAYFHALRGFGNRYSYFTTNSNQYSAYVITASNYVLLYALKYKKSILPFLPLLYLLLLFPMLESGSRTGTAVFASILLLQLGLVVWQANLIKKVFITGGIVTFISFAIPIGLALFNTNYAFRRSILGFAFFSDDGDTRGLNQGISIRTDQFELGFELQKANPFFGVGLGNFKNYHSHEIHNTFIAMFAEVGLVGVSIFSLLLLYPFYLILSKANTFIFKVVGFYLLFSFLLMNTTHVFMRERWTWLFLGSVILFCCTPKMKH